MSADIENVKGMTRTKVIYGGLFTVVIVAIVAWFVWSLRENDD